MKVVIFMMHVIVFLFGHNIHSMGRKYLDSTTVLINVHSAILTDAGTKTLSLKSQFRVSSIRGLQRKFPKFFSTWLL